MEIIPLQVILAWIKNNIIPIAVVLVLIGVYAYAHHEGAATEKARWVAIRNAEAAQYQKEIEAMRADAAAKAAQYAADKTKREANMVKIRKGTADAISKNVKLRECVADAEFVRLYGAAAHGADLSAP